MPYGYEGSPIINETGLVTGIFAAAQFPSRSCLRARFKANSGNTGSFFLGGSQATLYWELDAGQDTEWIEMANLNQLWFGKSSGSADFLSYWLQD